MTATKQRANLVVNSRRSFTDCLERGRDDPAAFAWDFLQLDLHDAQRRFIQGLRKPGIREGVLAAGNRFGKSELAAVLCLHKAFYQERDARYAYTAAGGLRPYTAANTSLTLEQASLVFDKAMGYAQAAKRFAPFIEKVISAPFPTMILKPIPGLADKGAELWARSLSHNGRYLMGSALSFVNVDEAALVPDLEEIVGNVLMMRLADAGGVMTFTSQPRGKNHFYVRHQRGLPGSAIYDPAVFAMTGTSFDNPHINHTYISQVTKGMTEAMIQENVYGEFTEADAFFPTDQVMRCYQDQDYRLPVPPGHDIVYVRRQGGALAEFRPTAAQATYVMGVDPARFRDQTCIAVLRVDVRPWQLVCFELIHRLEWTPLKERIADIHRRYQAWGLFDSTGAGQPVHESLVAADEPYQCDLEGYNFASANGGKTTLLVHLQQAVQNRDVVFPYHQTLVDQLTHYQLNDKRLATDAVMGLALAVKAAHDWQERGAIPAIVAPDLAPIAAWHDPRTGAWLVQDGDDDDLGAPRPAATWAALI